MSAHTVSSASPGGSASGGAPGPQGVKAVIASLRRAFPDFHLTIDDGAVLDDLVWLRVTGSGRGAARV